MNEYSDLSPLKVNVLSSLLQNVGLRMNPIMQGYVGTSTEYETTGGTYTFGTAVNNTVLKMLTYAIKAAYTNTNVDITTYNNITDIGDTVPALGNSKPVSFDWDKPPERNLVGPGWATSGWGGTNSNGTGQYTDYTYTNKNAISSWGFLRLLALQGWGEFNYNDTLRIDRGYHDFLTSFMSSYGFIEQSNQMIHTVNNSKTYLDGTYSNMNDLTTADIAGISLSTSLFGQDLIALGKSLNLSTISSFGLPSNLLLTLVEYNCVTKALSLAILASGIGMEELSDLLIDPSSATKTQERNLYGAYTVITGVDLEEILIPLNCKTSGIEFLSDLLNVKKLFPNSYKTLTVPIYNTAPGPTNSKTYYPIYNKDGINLSLSNPEITSQLLPVVPPGSPTTVIMNPAVTPIPVVDPVVSTIVSASVASGASSSATPTIPANSGGRGKFGVRNNNNEF